MSSNLALIFYNQKISSHCINKHTFPPGEGLLILVHLKGVPLLGIPPDASQCVSVCVFTNRERTYWILTAAFLLLAEDWTGRFLHTLEKKSKMSEH